MSITVTSNSKPASTKTSGMMVGGRSGHSGTHKERVGKVMMWGDNGHARATTEAYREGIGKLTEDKDKEKRVRQIQLAEEAKAEKERLKKLVYG